MNARVSRKISELASGIDKQVEKDNIWYWVRDSFNKASIAALFSKHHPLGHDLSMVQAVWYVTLIRK